MRQSLFCRIAKLGKKDETYKPEKSEFFVTFVG